MKHDDWLFLLVTLPWVIFLALVGGLVDFIRRLNESSTPKPLGKIFLKLAGTLTISGFAGLVTFLLCQDMQISPSMTAVLVAISGNLGGNAIDILTKQFNRFK
nr:phage holin family protein [uncultured Moraxella sp.]